MKRYLVPVIAILCITSLEGIALVKGIDGMLLASSIGGIGVIVGYFSRR